MIKINNELEIIRSSIDNINNQIASLLRERVKLVKRVGEIKKHKKNFYVAEREKFIFKSLSEKFPDLDKEIIKSVFTEIISGCRSYEKIFDVGILENPYSLTALHSILGTFTKHHFFKNLDELQKEYPFLDYVLFKLDADNLNFVEKSENIFIINYCDYENMRFYLLGKTENSDIISGKAGFITKSENFSEILKNLSDNGFKIEKNISSSKNICYIEVEFDNNHELINLENAKKQFLEPYKFLGTFPNNKF